MVWVLAFWLAMWPLMVIHELGHACAALRLTRGRVVVCLGSADVVFAFELGRLLVGIGRGSGGMCLPEDDAPPRDHAIIVAAGPAASSGTLVAMLAAGLVTDLPGLLSWPGYLLLALPAAAAVQLWEGSLRPFMTLPERRWYGASLVSDGLQLAQHLGIQVDETPRPASPGPRRVFTILLSLTVPLAFTVELKMGLLVAAVTIVVWIDDLTSSRAAPPAEQPPPPAPPPLPQHALTSVPPPPTRHPDSNGQSASPERVSSQHARPREA